MANFDEAWKFTRTWEGRWDDKGSDEGHYFPRRGKEETGINGFKWAKGFREIKCGTVFGITAQMLFDYVPGWQYPSLPTISRVKNLSEESAKSIWKSVAWKWCGGEGINDQNIATLLFDFMVRANGLCWKSCPSVVGLTKEQATLKISYVQLGTRSKTDVDAQRNQKVYPFNQVFIDRVNAYPNQKELFEKFKAKMTLHAPNRKNALQYNAMKYNTMSLVRTDIATEEKPIISPLGWYGLGVFVAGKLFKWW